MYGMTFNGLNQLKFSDYLEYILWSQMTKINYNLNYGWCTGWLLTTSTRHNKSSRILDWLASLVAADILLHYSPKSIVREGNPFMMNCLRKL